MTEKETGKKKSVSKSRINTKFPSIKNTNVVQLNVSSLLTQGHTELWTSSVLPFGSDISDTDVEAMTSSLWDRTNNSLGPCSL